MKSQMGVRETIEKEGKLTSADVEQIRERLVEQVPKPKVAYQGKDTAAHGDTLPFTIEGLPLPTFDFYEGRLREPDHEDDAKPLAAFPSPDGPILVPVDYEPKTGAARVVLPKCDTSAPIKFMFPVKAYLGPNEIWKYVDEGETLLNTAFRDGSSNSDALEECRSRASEFLKVIKKPIPREDPAFTEKCDPIFAVVTEIIWPFHVVCMISASLSTCILCPHDAISVAGDSCHVDEAKCRGYTYQTDGFDRIDEETCWECFNETDGSTSTKCPKRRIKKVLHIETPPCCGNCHSSSRLHDFQDLRALCPAGAVTQYWNPSYRYEVDKDICTGCQMCMIGLNCFQNDAADRSDRAIRMVAYITSE